MGGRAPAPDVSAAINISRLLCILGVVYVHAWTGRTSAEMQAMTPSFQVSLLWSLIELLGRSAVPLLSVISGWLVATAEVQRRPYQEFMGGKTRTLLAPMVAWNVIAMTIVCGAASLGWMSGPKLASPLEAIDQVLCLTAPNEVNVQMYFLRDLFVCMAMTPFLLRLPTWGLATVIAAVTVWFVGDFNIPLLLKPQILLFISLGMIAKRQGWERSIGGARWMWVILPFLIVAPVKILASIHGGQGAIAPWVLNGLDLSLRITSAVLMWRIASALGHSRIKSRLVDLSTASFLLFCSHMVFIWIGGPLIGRLTGPLGSPAYPIFLLSQPVLVFAAVLLLRSILSTLSPALTDFLTGRRDARPAPAKPVSAPAVGPALRPHA